MSEQGTPADGGAPESTPEATPEPSGPPEWLGPIQERMDELSTTTSGMADQLASLYREPEADEPQEDYLDEENLYGDDGEITPEGAQRIIDQRVDERLNNVLSKRDAQTALERREDAFEALRDEVPALQDDKLATRLVREVAAALEDSGQGAIIDTPLFVDLIEQRYKAELYDERAKTERESQPREVVLEAASGAAPQAKQDEDWGDRILKAADRLRPQI